MKSNDFVVFILENSYYIVLCATRNDYHVYLLGQGGQSHDTHVVISHDLFTFCARMKVCLTIIFLVFGGVQK